MKRMIRMTCPLLFLVAGAGTAGAQLPSNSRPAFIADERVLIGKYHYEETSDDFKMDVHLNADHTALYRITTGKDQAEFIRLTGFWTLDNPHIHIHNKPGPVRLVAAGAPTRDPSVGLSVTAMNADGSPAEGLGVTWADANGLYMLSDGRHTTRSGEPAGAAVVEIVRASDRKILQTVNVRPGGPNSFRFTYHPSDQEPFDLAAIALDPRADTIEVEVGTAQAKLKRVSK
ncbi:hypothetical protein [Sphingomonas sp. Leaf4]|uniref:hypothetical protein n=1 Tax=Sphingomonas sp. Leaf4 TaxID=2876553 RepID=UPI001E5B3755|nr:hypothetical protein [Sphingomonas sp. Leaf4]